MIRPGQFTLKFRPGLRLSDETFRRLCRANPDPCPERTANGELVVMPPAAAASSYRNAGLTAQLWNWNQRTGLGVVFDSSGGFTLPNTAIRGPDAAWMTRDRWDALPQDEREQCSRVRPDFVIELRSQSDRKKDLRAKMREYRAQGARLGWLIDPKIGTVEVYRPGRPVEVLKRPATLSGEDVLPGFVLDLSGILFN
jgi:Uma2 family endonuclease